MKDQLTIEKEIERLINQYGNDVLRMSYIYLKDQQLAEDAFQEVFMKVFNKFDSFRFESSEKTWVIKITINVCKDMLKNNWLKKVNLYDTDEIFNDDESYNVVEHEIDKLELFHQVMTLPEKYQEVIVLYYYQGFNVNEIASILNTTVGNVGSLLSRARAHLKNIL